MKTFRVRSAKDRLTALGADYNKLPLSKRACFSESPPECFQKLGKPGSGEWLDQHPEKGQTYDDYVQHLNQPSKKKNVLYLMPLDAAMTKYSQTPSECPFESGFPLHLLEKFLKAFFSEKCQVKILKPDSLSPTWTMKIKKIKKRINSQFGHEQLYTPDILAILKSIKPHDAYCLLGISLIDLYPSESWNFVFGQASLSEGIGVFSFARYDPKFWGEEIPNSVSHRKHLDGQLLLFRRSMRVSTHEIGHIFGMKHCVYYNCLMCGSNHQEESDKRAAELCPICLRKLHKCIGFDVVKRYRNILQFYKDCPLKSAEDVRQWFHFFESEIEWLEKRIQYLESSAMKPILSCTKI